MGEEWHVVRTRGTDAAIAAVGCAKAGWEVYLPTELLRVTYRGTHRGRSETQWRPLFARCMFAKFEPGRDLRRVSEIHGVDGVLRRDGRLVTVADDAIRALRRAERDGLFDLAGASRLPDGETEPLDARFASLMQRIKTSRGSKKRAAILMELLVPQPVSINPAAIP
jgi:hypothetical protein